MEGIFVFFFYLICVASPINARFLLIGMSRLVFFFPKTELLYNTSNFINGHFNRRGGGSVCVSECMYFMYVYVWVG